MLKRISTTTLVIVFALLLAIVFGIEFFKTGDHSKNLRTTLVEFDSSAVTSILIFPKSQKKKEIRVSKENNSWKVKLDNNHWAPVSDSRVAGSLSELLKVTPQRLVGNNKSQWREFETDTAGTRVKVFQGDKMVLDLIIGKFSFRSQRDMSTYVRLESEENVYSVASFLDLSFNRDIADWRNQTVINGTEEEWKKLSFTYPADSSFDLVKEDKKWKILVEYADSAKVAEYIRSIQMINHSTFVDDIDEKELGSPVYTLKIESKVEQPLDIKAFPHAVHEWLITSSQNPGVVFKSPKSSLIDKIFINKAKLSRTAPPVMVTK